MAEAGYEAGAAASRAASSGRMLAPEQIDDLGRAVLLLARELWVTKDRQRVLEAVLEARGIEVAQAIRDHQPDEALAAELAAERERFTQALIAALCPPAEGAS
jgi:K+-sensing histidine kinase KdpD